MSNEDQEILDEFVVESLEHLADIESQLLTIEAAGADVDVDLVNTVFRGVHSIKGAAGFLGLPRINELAHCLENVLNLMREEKLVPTSSIVDGLLSASDTLQAMVADVGSSNEVDISDHLVALENCIASGVAGGVTTQPTAIAETPPPAPPSPPSPPEADAIEVQIREDLPLAEALDQAVADAKRAREQAAAEAAEAAKLKQPTSVPAPVIDSSSASLEPGEGRKAAGPKSAAGGESSIRVSVETVDHLMNLAGELVLSRNQLLQALAARENNGFESVAARINQVTTEMQDAIMKTRMQPIGNVFNKFSRVVRDLTAKLDKRINLSIEGSEVEVDKTIIEAISDPLTHLIRNAVDHGMETPAQRLTAGKAEYGNVYLRAQPQSGKVVIEIQDDGRGINADVVRNKALDKGLITADQAQQMSDREAARLIFLPGFSTAEQISDVSGRGVGMDVVRTNIEKLGGSVEIFTTLGTGTCIQITLPLTLAIIPSLIVRSGADRLAIPQVNINELVRVRPEDAKNRFARVKGADVLRLRNSLLPVVRLNEVFGGQTSGRTIVQDLAQEGAAAQNVIVVETGQQRYGILVDGLCDSEEIVVKPVGAQLNDCPCLSGATILGDGRVALIVDVSGIANYTNLRAITERANAEAGEKQNASRSSSEVQSVLLFNNREQESFAIPMGMISRIESIAASEIESVGHREMLHSRGVAMPLIQLDMCVTAAPADRSGQLFVIVYSVSGREVGLLASHIEDIRAIPLDVDTDVHNERGIAGSLAMENRTVRVLNLHDITHTALPDLKGEPKKHVKPDLHLCLAEDSAFFRKQVSNFLRDAGFNVSDFEDGQEAWETLIQDKTAFDLVVTDIEMPRMNGLEFCRRIKADPQLCRLPVIALTSLASESDVSNGRRAGIDDYQVKLDRENLIRAIRELSEKAMSQKAAEPLKEVLV
ncbi:Chemotaxis protein CheA [Rosistilla carotiformis]|uniref:histidine kinase n=1 Tax=Rosistilla carotiformis TaxID=2528017 RepID=A0A518JZR5_9BACT|nr:chemotaxis protein CheW [Rosistilla carotiformis]QDV71038.1 Chemotaxis protein CheA [Rosistilla carotiformis]